MIQRDELHDWKGKWKYRPGHSVVLFFSRQTVAFLCQLPFQVTYAELTQKEASVSSKDFGAFP